MTQWKGKRAIVKKYQISPEELLRILNKGEVAYSDVDGVLMVDEESFVAYIDSLRQAVRQNNAVNRLKQVLRSGKKLELDKAESVIAHRLEDRVDSIYALATRALSMLLEPKERKIFLAFINGDTIWSVARQTGLRNKQVCHIFENSIKKLGQAVPYVIQRLTSRCQEMEEANRDMVQKLAECNNWFSHVDLQVQEMEVKIAHAQRQNEFFKSYLDYLQAMFDAERKINAEMEKMLYTRHSSFAMDYLSAIKSYFSRLFHLARN